MSDQAKRRERAARLRARIKSTEKQSPRTPRDFVEERMRELAEGDEAAEDRESRTDPFESGSEPEDGDDSSDT